MMHSENHVLPQTYLSLTLGTGMRVIYTSVKTQIFLFPLRGKKNAAHQMTVWIIGAERFKHIFCSSQIKKICH